MNCTQILNDREENRMQQKRNQQAEIRLGSHGEDYGSWMPIPCSTLSEEAFGSRRRAAMMMLGSSRLLVGRK